MAKVNTRGSTLQDSRWCPGARALRRRSADAPAGSASQARGCMSKAGFPSPGDLFRSKAWGRFWGPPWGPRRRGPQPRSQLEPRGRARDPGLLVDSDVLAPLPSGAPSGSGTSGPALGGPAPPLTRARDFGPPPTLECPASSARADECPPAPATSLRGSERTAPSHRPPPIVSRCRYKPPDIAPPPLVLTPPLPL